MSKSTRSILDIILFLVAFVAIQAVAEFVAAFIFAQIKGLSVNTVVQGMASGSFSSVLAISTVVSSLITAVLFALLRWTPMSRHWIRTRPWGVLSWVVLLSLGIILPAEWLYERLEIAMPMQAQALFEGIMKEPWGYAAIGIMAPIAEEVVFRGAILRALLNLTGNRRHWVAIVCSALIFGLVHMNLAQGLHAFLIGLLLGWFYYRTGSILPGIALHWVNNSVAYLMFNLMPELADGKLIDLFHGSDRTMYLGLAFSLCVALPSMFQLALRMRR